MKAVESFQIRKIYSIGNALGIVQSGRTDDELHLLVGAATGKESVKELSYSEADTVISRLEQLQGGYVPPERKDTKNYSQVPGGITQGQQKKVWALMYDLRKYDKEISSAAIGDRLCGVIKNELHIDCMVKNPFQWLDFDAGNKLIEILKKYVSSAKRKRGGKCGINDGGIEGGTTADC